jgi:hypothetical protein
MISLCCIRFLNDFLSKCILVLTGSYCIYKNGTCPEDMTSGWVTWDDENDQNHNSFGGFVPDGTYDKDTKLEYCC